MEKLFYLTLLALLPIVTFAQQQPKQSNVPLTISSILVRDALGRIVWRMAGQKNFRGTSIAVRNFNPGMYVVELQTAVGIQSIPFVKK